MKSSLIFALVFMTFSLSAQHEDWQTFEPAISNPYGQPHPDAPEQIKDFHPMIGTCDCRSLQRNPDQSWQDTTDMVWTFKYILNGTAVQDLTWHEKFYATSIRQVQPDSGVWVVTYNSSNFVSMSSKPWIGKKEGTDIVLKQPQKAPNGMDGTSRLTFTDINEKGFNWRGEWVNEEQGIVFPFWLIWCKKRD